MTHPVIEIVARAIRRNRFERNGRLDAFDPELPLTDNEMADGQAAIIALLDAITEPTEAELNAARDWSYAKYGRAIGNDAAAGCRSAMLQTCRDDILGAGDHAL